MGNGLSAAHVGELVRELAPLVAERFLREVQAHPPFDLLLVVEPGSGGAIRRLRLSASPEGPRFHLQVGPVKKHRGTVGPFFQTVQASLAEHPGETKVRGIAQVAGDRVVRVDLLTPNGPRAVVLELFGRQPNLLLLDAAGRVLAVTPTPAKDSRNAVRLALGTAWEAAHSPAPRGTDGPTLLDAFPLDPASTAEAPAAPDSIAALAPLSARVEATLGRSAEARFDERKGKDLVERLTRRRKSAAARLAGLRKQEESTRDAERVRMDAELLTAHLFEVRRGAAEIEVDDAYAEDGAPARRVIALDPGLSPKRNAERMFSRYKKLLRTIEKLPDEIALARAQVEGLDAWIARAADDSNDPDAIEAEAVQGGWIPARQVAPERKRVEKRKPYHRFVGCAGSEIRVGRTARENDELTFRHARGNDLWLHTSDSPGSHVVLVLEKGAAPDPEEVLDAAHLAIHYSPQKDASKAGVHVAYRKEVRKPRGAKPGLVTLSGGKVRMIRVEPARLERLLTTREKPRPGSSPPAS